MFSKEENKETRDTFYKVCYKIIKEEILENGHSDVLNEILNSTYDTMNLNTLIEKEIKETEFTLERCTGYLGSLKTMDSRAYFSKTFKV